MVAPIQELKQRLAETTADVARLAVLVDLGKRRTELSRDEVEGYLREAVGLAQKTRRYKGVATTSVLLSEICLEAGDTEGSVEWAGVVQEAAMASGDPDIEGQYLYIMGRTWQHKGDYSSARDSYERCLETWRKAGNTVGVGAALNQLASLAMLQGQATEALAQYQECLKIDDELGDIENGALHQYNIGELLRRVGRPEDALESYYRVLALTERYCRTRRLRAPSLSALGELFLERDKTAKAIGLFRMAADAAERDEAQPDVLRDATAGLGLAYHRQRDYASARQAYSQALTIAEESGERCVAAVVLWRMAELALDLSQLDRCRDLAKRAVAVSREMGLRCEEAQGLRVLALCHAARGEDTLARECFEQALPLLCDLEESPDLARVRFHYGRYLLARGEREAALVHLRAASRKFRELSIAEDGYRANRLLLQEEMEGDRDMALLRAISGLPTLGVEPRVALERAIELLLEALGFDCAVVVARGRPILVLGDPRLAAAIGLAGSEELVANDLVLSWPVRSGRSCLGRIHLERTAPRAAEQNCLVLDAIANLLATVMQRLCEQEVSGVEGRPELTRLCYRGAVGQSQRMLDVLATVCAVADKSEPVLIRGERGTGKNVIARALHDSSARAGRPFTVVSCAGVADDLLQVELFGSENGGTTDSRPYRGKFEAAKGGTVFLDEVGYLGPALQASLLQVLYEKAFKRVGGSIPVSVDARVVASTARPIEEILAQGSFREDLHARLEMVELVLPPLKERPEDIPDLVRYFVRRSSAEFGRGVTGVSPEAMSLLTSCSWPGNVSELEHVVECSVVLAEGDTVQISDLPPGLQHVEGSG